MKPTLLLVIERQQEQTLGILWTICIIMTISSVFKRYQCCKCCQVSIWGEVHSRLVIVSNIIACRICRSPAGRAVFWLVSSEVWVTRLCAHQNGELKQKDDVLIRHMSRNPFCSRCSAGCSQRERRILLLLCDPQGHRCVCVCPTPTLLFQLEPPGPWCR